MSNAGPVTKLSELLLIDFSAISAISFFFFNMILLSHFVCGHKAFQRFRWFSSAAAVRRVFLGRKEIDSRWLLLQFYRNADPAKISQVSSCWSRQFMVRIFPHLLGLCNLFPWLFIIIVVGVWCDLVRKRPEEMPTEMVISATSYSFQFSTPASWVKVSCVYMGHATCL